MNNITTEQNGKFYIDRLAAQRHLYTQCKWINGLHFCVSVLAVVLLTLVKMFSCVTETWLNYIALYSLVVAVANPLLTQKVASKQLLSAKIQQWFDTDLFKLEWDEVICGPKPNAGDVHKAMNCQKKEDLDNWYVPEEISSLKHNNGVLVCMKENVYYDKRLRELFKFLCIALSVICLIIVIAIALTNNSSTWDVVIKEVLPLLPLYNWMYSVIKQNCGSIKQLENVQNHLMNFIDKAITGEIVTKDELNKMQNLIFVHRKVCYVIPDLLYSTMRNVMEKEAAYDINALISKLK